MAKQTETSNPNMNFWDAFRAVPECAQKPIQDGKLKGKTDINPVWRLKMLTDKFGPCGKGWHYETVERWTDTNNAELVANVRIRLFIHPAGEEPWFPIEGVGGSKIYGRGKGDYMDDEAWKMATTDAISVACKSLGMAADIYFAKDAAGGRWDKYDHVPEQQNHGVGMAPGAAPAQIQRGQNQGVPPGLGHNAPAPRVAAPAPAQSQRQAAPAQANNAVNLGEGYTEADLEIAKAIASAITTTPAGVQIAPATYQKLVAGAAVGAKTKNGAPCEQFYFTQYDRERFDPDRFFEDVNYIRAAIKKRKETPAA